MIKQQEKEIDDYRQAIAAKIEWDDKLEAALQIAWDAPIPHSANPVQWMQ